jgi:excisionase family DNA binding protein
MEERAGKLETPLLTIEQLAARWGVNRKTIYAAIARKEVHAIRIGRVLRVPASVIESLEQGRVVSSGGSG